MIPLKRGLPLVVLLSAILAFALACGGETIKEVTVVVKETVQVEKQVPVEKIVKETVVVEKQVPVEKVVKETVVVEKQVPIEKIVKETVIVEKKVVETVVAIATPTPSAAPAPGKGIVPEGELVGVVGGSDITAGMTGWFPDCVYCASTVHVGSHEGLFMGGRDKSGKLTIVPWIVDTWETAPDASYTDFKLRKGIQFQRGFGELTAEDVAWYFNLASTVTNPESKNDTGVQIPVFQGADVIDKYTVRFHWKDFAAHTLAMRFTDLQEGMGPFSKRAFDERGKEWMKDNFIGTGPFLLKEWTENEVIKLEAQTEHWRKVPYVAKVRLLAVPEAATRRAMMETGQAQAGAIALKDIPDMLAKGYKMAPETNISTFAVTFSGNYWETKHAVTGEPLERVRNTKKPWIGDPADPASMERSKKVRTALALAIDRQAVVDEILKGIGQPHYLGSIWMQDPMFQENADRWTIPYDPDQARALMKEAGYADGFPIQIWTGPGGFGVELWEAVGNFWITELNVKPVFDRADYTQFRPSIVARTSQQVFSGCCYGPAQWPNEWTLNSANSPGGYNVGMELPMAAKTAKIKNTTRDPEELNKAAFDILEYLHEWMLWPGVVQWPGGAVYNPKAMEWERMRPFQWMRLGGLRSFEWVKLK